VLPRSRSSTPCASTSIAAWLPETELSRIWSELPGFRPIVKPLPPIGIVSPFRSPDSKRRE